MDNTSHLIPVFVYGTLRVGGGLHGMIEEDVVYGPIQATVKGSLYSNTSFSYPYYVEEGDTDVVGEVFFVRRGIGFNQVAAMEIGAGYDMKVIAVNTGTGFLNVVAFPLAPRWKSLLGAPIRSGDWIEYEKLIWGEKFSNNQEKHLNT